MIEEKIQNMKKKEIIRCMMFGGLSYREAEVKLQEFLNELFDYLFEIDELEAKNVK